MTMKDAWSKHAEAAKALGDCLMRWLDDHSALCSDPDCNEPANILAYLCHSVGLRSTDLSELSAELLVYESDCKCCSHLRN